MERKSLVLILGTLCLLAGWSCGHAAVNSCIESGPYHGPMYCGWRTAAITNQGSLTATTIDVCVGSSVPLPALASNPGFNPGLKYQSVWFSCPQNQPFYIFSTVYYQFGSLYFVPQIPSTFNTAGTYYSTGRVDLVPSPLVGWWSGENDAKDKLSGLSGTGNNIGYGPGKVGQCFVLGGNHDSVYLGNSTNWNLFDFSIEAWVQRASISTATADGLGSGMIFSYGNEGYGFGMFDNGQLFLTKIDYTVLTGPPAVTDLGWHHVGVVKSNSIVTFYLDGVAYPSPYAWDPGFRFHTPAAIGARGDNQVNSFFGSLDEVSVYACPLGSDTMQAIHAAGAVGKCWNGSPGGCALLPPGCNCDRVIDTVATVTYRVHNCPTINTQPVNQIADVGGTATFSVSAGGTPPLSYQWLRNGVAVAGATASTLNLSGLHVQDAGNYSVLIGNSEGGVTESALARLSVFQAGAVVAWGDDSLGQCEPPTSLTDPVGVAAGEGHSLALQHDGTVVGWGEDDFMQADVPSGLSGVVQIAAGSAHSLALDNNGNVWPWGDNSFGQRQVPNDLAGVVSIAVGALHNLALESDGTVVAWGDNTWGQTNVPPGLGRVVSVAASGDLSVALKEDGTVVAWGANAHGETNVPSLTGAIGIGAGNSHGLALKSDTSVVAWGDDSFGQTNVPPGLSGVMSVVGGDYHSLALKLDGSLVAWGDDWAGQAEVPDATTVATIAAGGMHNLAIVTGPVIFVQPQNVTTNAGASTSFAVTASGPSLTYQWQKNGFDLFDVGNVSGSTTATLTLANITDGDAGTYSVNIAGAGITIPSTGATLIVLDVPIITVPPASLAVNAGSPAQLSVQATTATTPLSYQWLKNGSVISEATDSTFSLSNAQVGDTGIYSVLVINAQGITQSTLARLSVFEAGAVVSWGDDRYGQRDVPSDLGSAVAVAGGTRHSLAILPDGTVKAWGSDDSGQREVPSNAGPAVQVAAGEAHSVSLDQNGVIHAWGDPTYGQCNPPSLAPVVAIAAGANHSMALQNDGTVAVWGDDTYHQADIPKGLIGVVGIAASGNYCLALKQDGTVVAWGDDTYGQCEVPPTLTGVTAIAAGTNHCLAITSDGTIIGWGDDSEAETTALPGLPTVQSVAAGYDYSLALGQDGNVSSWGDNSYGQTTTPVILDATAVAAGTYHGLAIVPGVAILQPPASRCIGAGSSVDLSVTATGPGLTYQWSKDGVDLIDGTTATLNLSAVASGDAGVYSVRVTSGTDTLVSSNAIVRVVTTSLASQTANVGSAVQFGISLASPGEPLAYQWLHNGVLVGSGTALSIGSAQLADAGVYAVIVSNSVGSQSILARLSVFQAGAVVAWGDDSYTQCDVPSGVASAVAVAGGVWHSLAILPDGTVKGWGANASGQCVPPGDLGPAVQVAAGLAHSLSLDANGVVRSWGDSAYVPSLAPVVEIAAGANHSVALQDDGTVAVWGDDTYHQTDVPKGLSGVVGVAASGDYCLALKQDGTVVAWGDDTYGQCDVPPALTGVTAIAAGTNHCLALKTDGTVVAWGLDNDGDGVVPAGLGGVLALAAGDNHSLALRLDGSVSLWGDNSMGQAQIPVGYSGVAASAGANHTLVLVTGPFIFRQPLDVLTNPTDTVAFKVGAAGPSLTYQWLKNGSPVSDNSTVSRSTTTELTLSGVQESDMGSYSVVVSSGTTSLTSSNALLEVVPNSQLVPIQPPSCTTHTGVTVTFTAQPSYYGTGILSYQWQRHGVNLSDAGEFSGTTTATLTLTDVAEADADWYTVVVTSSADDFAEANSAVLTLANAPTITTQPSSQTVGFGGTANFTVAATGLPPLTYQWRKGGEAIFDDPLSGHIYGAQTPSLTLNQVTAYDADSYTVVVRSPGWAVTSSPPAVLTVLDPQIVTQPRSQTVGTGGTVSFSIVAAGSGTLSYQWKQGTTVLSDSERISGSTTATLSVSNVVAGDAGSYTAAVANDSGTATSDNAVLTVNQLPLITIQPQSQTPIAGSIPTLSVTADSSTGPFTYQWQRNGVNLSGATDSTLALSLIQADRAGMYSVLVGNSWGTTQSDLACVRVWTPGVAVAWGDDSLHQTEVTGAYDDIVALAAGAGHTVAIHANHSLAAWGLDDQEQCDYPVLNNAVSVVAGAYHSLALGSDGIVVPWGDDTYGQTDIPADLGGVVAIAAGSYHNLALLGNGTVVAWGDDTFGQTDVPDGLDSVIAIAAGGDFSLALKKDGSVVAWGDNSFEQTVVPPALGPVDAIAAGAYHVLVLGRDGSVSGWGRNDSGERNIPNGLAGVVGLSAGGYHSLALQLDGTVRSWGDNTQGESSIPSGTVASAIAAGEAHSAAVVLSPVILQQPIPNQTVDEGATVTFTVVAGGSGPYSYQWFVNGTALVDSLNVSGSATATLVLHSVTMVMSGNVYTVKITKGTNVLTSSGSVLTVNASGSATYGSENVVNLEVYTPLK